MALGASDNAHFWERDKLYDFIVYDSMMIINDALLGVGELLVLCYINTCSIRRPW